MLAWPRLSKCITEMVPNQPLSTPPVLIKAEKADVPLPMDAGAECGGSQLGLQADSLTSHGFGGGGCCPFAADQLGTWTSPGPKVSEMD